MTTLFQPLRSVANGLGLAWWARVETRQPDVTYWFGPYVRRSSLQAALSPFLADLRSEGAARELVNRIQRLRREAELEITDRIEVVVGGDPALGPVVDRHGPFIAGEVLAVSLRYDAEGDPGLAHRRELDLDGIPAVIALQPVSAAG